MFPLFLLLLYVQSCSAEKHFRVLNLIIGLNVLNSYFLSLGK